MHQHSQDHSVMKTMRLEKKSRTKTLLVFQELALYTLLTKWKHRYRTKIVILREGSSFGNDSDFFNHHHMRNKP